MVSKRLKELMAMVMIGDGMLALLYPKRHVALWRGGPQFYQRLLDRFAQYAGVTRVLGALETGLGLYVAWREYGR